MTEERLQVIRYTIDPQIPEINKKKAWVWMEKHRLCYAGSIGSSLMAHGFNFWSTRQSLCGPLDSVGGEGEAGRQATCVFTVLSNEMYRKTGRVWLDTKVPSPTCWYTKWRRG